MVALRDVTKHYARGGGIEEVSFAVGRGEIFGFLGPNGAGKTTTIRLVLDLIRPDHGEIAVFGRNPRREGVAIRRRLGYLPGDLALYERLTARELLTHFAHLRHGPSWSAIAEIAQRFDLELDRPIRALSRGNRQKVGLVQALMGNPELLVLDEPTSGLDPLVQRQVHEVLREGAASGQTVMLSSHVLSEVEQVAERVAMIREGRLVAVERVSTLRSRSVHLVEVDFDAPGDASMLAGIPGVRGLEVAQHHARFEIAGDLDPLVRRLAQCHLVDLSIREPDLASVFLALYTPEEPSRSSRQALRSTGRVAG